MKKLVHRSTLKAANTDLAYWLSRSMEERIAAVEVLRQQAFTAQGEVQDAQQKLQRVVRITRLHEV